MFIRQIERVKRSRLIDRLLVATSIDKTDDPIEHLCLENDIPCFRGSLDDVLDRFYQAARQFEPDHIVRLTGDCPLIDPHLIDEIVTFHLTGDFDYTSNTLEPTYPDGLDVEVFRFSCLEQAWRETNLPLYREHVTLFIWQQAERYKLGSFKSEVDLSNLRWTVDELIDFKLIEKVYETLHPSNAEFTTEDILAFFDQNPELGNVNTHHERNERLKKSLAKNFLHKQENKEG